MIGSRTTLRSSCWPPRLTVMVTDVPAWPRIRLDVWSGFWPWTSFPSTLMIMSPDFIPALAAGEPGKTLSTTG